MKDVVRLNDEAEFAYLDMVHVARLLTNLKITREDEANMRNGDIYEFKEFLLASMRTKEESWIHTGRGEMYKALRSFEGRASDYHLPDDYEMEAIKILELIKRNFQHLTVAMANFGRKILPMMQAENRQYFNEEETKELTAYVPVWAEQRRRYLHKQQEEQEIEEENF